MAQRPDQGAPDSRMDAASLYREDIVTDRKVGTIRRMIPLKTDGSDDSARPTIYVGEAQIMTNAGPLPINFDIEAKNLAEAVEKFGDSAKEAVERTVRELQELRRQQASSIVVPGAGGMGGLGGPGGPGKIQIP
ncbi:MAG: hypothetical protein Q8L65_12965 [Burkholderiales bacterium]|nr:hypothetical protein [Burkholderiales bacterium]MDP2398488.1 hypothetical protein [Burkholderiales bacterium]